MNARTVRVAVYGAGNFANSTHIPNLKTLERVEIVAVCDQSRDRAQATAERFGIPGVYTDAHIMLEQEHFDALCSIVPAYARTDVEITAAARGIHIFSEKPQTLTMSMACRIDAAIRQAGVISTVGFRERYRPIFREARKLLQDKRVVHVRFQQISGYPERTDASTWWSDMEKGGAPFFDWGVHATDYTRYMTGQNIARAQAFACQPDGYAFPLSTSLHYHLFNEATATLTFIQADPGGLANEPYFTIFFEGGRLALFGYERIEINGKTVYEATPFDPWLEQDRTFVEAVLSGNPDLLLSDYYDGLWSLAPVLAGWESFRNNGMCVDVPSFLES
jgi:predicted dehydrogenase